MWIIRMRRKVALGVACLLFLSLASFADAARAGLVEGSGSWLQACFDGSRSCFNPYEKELGPANADGLALAWRARIDTDGESSVVYADGRMFVGTREGLVGLDPATGAIIINYRSGPVSTTPAVIRGFDPQPDPPGKVVFGSSDGTLHAVSTSGEPLWQVGLAAAPVAPLVIQAVGDPTIRIVVGAGDTLFSFDGDGNRQWETVLEGGDISKAAAALRTPAGPERVIVAVGNTLYALDVATGRALWRTVPSGARLGAPSIGNPNIIGDPNVLVGDEAGTLFSLDPRNGAIRARFDARAPISDSPAIGDPNQSHPWVFIGDSGGNIYAVDQTDWFPAPDWSVALSAPVGGPPVLANGVVYVGTDPAVGNAHIFALDATSGRTLFDSILPGGVASSPIVADGRLIVATRSGDLLSYDGPDS
jgi:outer membrane protein assembly factor BamB